MTGDDDEVCRIAVDKTIKIASDLNEFVVTFDKIFSRMAFAGAGPDLLIDYMTDRNVRRRLAEVRTVVFDALERVIGEEAADDIAESGYRHFE